MAGISELFDMDCHVFAIRDARLARLHRRRSVEQLRQLDTREFLVHRIAGGDAERELVTIRRQYRRLDQEVTRLERLTRTQSRTIARLERALEATTRRAGAAELRHRALRARRSVRIALRLSAIAAPLLRHLPRNAGRPDRTGP
jgi:predicted RNase H-like nuclease (RuvC/YqgF family)